MQDDLFLLRPLKEFPSILLDLTDKDTFSFTYADLLKRCENIDYFVIEERPKNVEAHTRQRAKSNIWFRYRAGRITASKLKSACRTNAGAAAISLIKLVCDLDLCRFSTEATRWGCDHELQARQAYEDYMCTEHPGFIVKDAGLIINPKYPHLGATPDGLVQCAEHCCGDERFGVCEIKCPFCKDMSLMYAAEDKQFCLQDVNGELHLSNEHAYYYQVQIFVLERSFCDFVVWTSDDVCPHIERIVGNHAFWTDSVAAATHFFKVGMLPELVGKHFTSPPKNVSENVHWRPMTRMNKNGATVRRGTAGK
ncbi:uncharacterized protein LOC144604216 [Rhinoraja longicauda]